jgi:hypothetical protein
MGRPSKGEQLPSMRLGLRLTAVEVEIEEEREIDAEGDIDAAEGVTNKAIRLC